MNSRSAQAVAFWLIQAEELLKAKCQDDLRDNLFTTINRLQE